MSCSGSPLTAATSAKASRRRPSSDSWRRHRSVHHHIRGDHPAAPSWTIDLGCHPAVWRRERLRSGLREIPIGGDIAVESVFLMNTGFHSDPADPTDRGHGDARRDAPRHDGSADHRLGAANRARSAGGPDRQDPEVERPREHCRRPLPLTVPGATAGARDGYSGLAIGLEATGFSGGSGVDHDFGGRSGLAAERPRPGWSCVRTIGPSRCRCLRTARDRVSRRDS